MKGIVKNDFYSVMEYCRALLFVMVLFIIVGIAKHNVLFMILYPLLLLSIIPVSVISVDERFGWDKYMLTLPISKKDYVTSKYLFHIILMGIGLIFTFAVSVLMKVDLISVSLLAAVLIVFSLIFNGILFPFMFRFGVAKGKIIYMAFMAAWGCIFGFLSSSFYVENIRINDLYQKYFSGGLLGIVVIFAAALYVLSMLISIKVYKKRDI